MYWFLLGPLGVEQVARTLHEAWSSYLAVRSRQEAHLNVQVDRIFENEVRASRARVFTYHG